MVVRLEHELCRKGLSTYSVPMDHKLHNKLYTHRTLTLLRSSLCTLDEFCRLPEGALCLVFSLGASSLAVETIL